MSFAVMQTLVVPALPFFRQEFGTSQADTTWLVTGFLLSSSVLTPLLGKLGDMYGKKRLLVVSMAIFGLGSLAAAAGSSLVWLVACRVIQGAGAAVFPLSFGIIRDEFPRERIGVAIGARVERVRPGRRDRPGRQRLRARQPGLGVAVRARRRAPVLGGGADRG